MRVFFLLLFFGSLFSEQNQRSIVDSRIVDSRVLAAAIAGHLPLEFRKQVKEQVAQKLNKMSPANAEIIIEVITECLRKYKQVNPMYVMDLINVANAVLESSINNTAIAPVIPAPAMPVPATPNAAKAPATPTPLTHPAKAPVTPTPLTHPAPALTAHAAVAHNHQAVMRQPALPHTASLVSHKPVAPLDLKKQRTLQLWRIVKDEKNLGHSFESLSQHIGYFIRELDGLLQQFPHQRVDDQAWKQIIDELPRFMAIGDSGPKRFHQANLLLKSKIKFYSQKSK